MYLFVSRGCILKYCSIFALHKLTLMMILPDKDVTVHTRLGPVKGYEQDNSFYAFKNVPFAKPPIGNLRFELPQPCEPWNFTSEFYFGKDIYCSQNGFGQEDCLYLDIYMRKKKEFETGKSLLPVLMYFHAGRFSKGSKDEYNSKFLLKYNDIIIVIPNYRLGILGFLSLTNSTLQGNLGLWDQRIAMQWVYENIKNFGGNPKRITIAGHDAGGASVGFHILSKQSRKYFSGAISGSGTALDPWALDTEPSTNADIVLKNLNCLFSNLNATIICLKMCPLGHIFAIQNRFMHIELRPIVDEYALNPFLPSIPEKLYEENLEKEISYLAGATTDDAMSEVNKIFKEIIKTRHFDLIFHHLLEPYLKNIPNLDFIIQAAKLHYIGGVDFFTFESAKSYLVKMMTDFLYNAPLQTTLRLHSEKASNTFMYVFENEDTFLPEDIFTAEDSVRSENISRYNATEDITDYFGNNTIFYNATSHMKDAIYLFNTTFLKMFSLNITRMDIIEESLCTIWGDFIKYRHFPDLEWKRFQKEEMNYVKISETMESKRDYRKEDIGFWTALMPYLQKMQKENTEEKFQLVEPQIDPFPWGVTGLGVLLIVFFIGIFGVVIVTRRRSARSTLLPHTAYKERVEYSSTSLA